MKKTRNSDLVAETVSMEMKKTKEEWHLELQQSFMRTVTKMIESECELPKTFKPWYVINEHSGRDEHSIFIRACLTEKEAKLLCLEDVKWGSGKHWGKDTYEIIVPNGYTAEYEITHLF